MKLYHGTSEKIARQALTRGLKPRADTGVDTTWPENPSRADMVYFTSAYALSFAMMASEKDENWGIVEVDTDLMEEPLFHPDEDFLEQATRQRTDLIDPTWSMEVRTRAYQAELECYQPHWKLSVENLGNCCYLGQVVPAEITRVAIFDPEKAPVFTMMAADPQISLINFMLLGKTKYRAVMDWLFGNIVSLVAFDPTFAIGQFPEGYPEALVESIQERKKQMQAALDDRSAIEILLPEAMVGA